MRSLVFAFVALLAAPAAVAAQVPSTIPALQLTKLEQVGGEYRYSYRLLGPTLEGETMADVYLGLRMPRGSGEPKITGTQGDFMFDAVAEQGDVLTYSHPDVHISTPDNWSAAIFMNGSLSWGAVRYFDGTNYGVPHEKALPGFELRSAAVPSFRRYRAIPYRPVSTAGVTEVTDTTWVVRDGYVLAPGWSEDVLSAEFLLEQVSIGCQTGMLVDCGRYLLLAEEIQAAEIAQALRPFRGAVRSFNALVRADEDSHRNIRFVLERAGSALLDKQVGS